MNVMKSKKIDLESPNKVSRMCGQVVGTKKVKEIKELLDKEDIKY